MPIREDLGWCDDPSHPLYNRPVRLPFAASHEKMWRDDHAYDIVVTLGHNTDPARPGEGSAVFVHLTKTRDGVLTPTEGCLAMPEAVLRSLLRTCGPRSSVEITAA